MKLFKKIIKFIAIRTGRFKTLYIKICKPSGTEWALYLKKYGNFYSIGDHCMIWPYTNVPNPQYVKIGNNVIMGVCSIFGHDGVIAMLNRAYNKNLDSVGSVEIKDNVFVGYGAIIMPGVTVGPNSVVAAGSVVTSNVASGIVVGGVPAKTICSIDELIIKLENKTKQFPWYDLILKRQSAFDASLEPELIRKRVKYFFNED